VGEGGKRGKGEVRPSCLRLVREACRQTSATVSLIFVEPSAVADAIIEAVEGGLRQLFAVLPEFPSMIWSRSNTSLEEQKEPSYRSFVMWSDHTSQCRAGVMPVYVFAPGPVGMISSVDTLGYERPGK